jgi:hypothetical protein
MDDVEIRLECLRVALEYGTQRDVLNPDHLADKYYEWVTQGSESHRPVASRKDDSPTRAKKSRGVRKGSTPQLV